MTLHATLSPSSAERWTSCPASIRMERLVPPETGSAYAAEGTAAHALAEIMARHQLLSNLTDAELAKELKKWRKEYGIADDAEAEMTEHCQGYVDYLRERLAQHNNAVLLLEQRLPTGLPDSWGTSDAIIVSEDVVESIDLKYGLGVRVEAVGNKQLRLYAVGALEEFGELLGQPSTVRCTVYQPRLDHVASEDLTPAELVAWRDSLLPVAEQALGDDAPFGPSEVACRWCPASGSCTAQMEWATERDFGIKPDVMSAEELARALDDIPAIRAWCDATQDYAKAAIYSRGVSVPGWKVVLSGGRRSVANPEGLIESATALGYGRDEVAELKAKGIGALEKVLKGDFDLVAGPYVTKSDGSPSLVPESDKRPAINPEAQAAADFGEPAPQP